MLVFESVFSPRGRSTGLAGASGPGLGAPGWVSGMGRGAPGCTSGVGLGAPGWEGGRARPWGGTLITPARGGMFWEGRGREFGMLSQNGGWRM